MQVPESIRSTSAGEDVPLTRDEYVLRVGDIMDIKFYYGAELNEEVTIRPDGKISLQLIGEVKAAGLRPDELRKILSEKYTPFLRHPDVAVLVKKIEGYMIYVGGEINAPGVIKMSGQVTSLRAIMQAGGFKNTAALDSVVVIRDRSPESPLFITVKLNEDLAGDNRRNDIPLQPYDVVFVPKTTIAKINQFMEQYFDKLIPISKSFGFGYVYNLNQVP